MTIRPIQKYTPKKIYQTNKLENLKDLFFEQPKIEYNKKIIKDYVYYSVKVQIA